MNPSVRRIAPFTVIALFVSSAFAANNFDPTQFSTGNFHGCPSTGQGSDPYLNSLKNRDKPPTTSMPVYTVNKLYQVTPSLPNRKVPRSKWTQQQRDLAARWESRPVAVEGYLIHAPVLEGQEACNCKSDTYLDHHMWLGPTPTASRTRAMVVEISPRAWPNHPAWKNATATLKPVVDHKEKVRVGGWLTWDQEHKEQLRKTRRTLWEVHPIHLIQVFRGDQWVTL